MRLVSTAFELRFTAREDALWQRAMRAVYDSSERFEPPRVTRFHDGWLVQTWAHLYLGVDDTWHQEQGAFSMRENAPALFPTPGDAICRLAWVLRRPLAKASR